MKTTNPAECVILLHGLARTHRSMNKMAKYLDRKGYIVFNVGYPSTKYPIETLAQKTISQAIDNCPSNTKINFVTHSMGGILLRQYLQDNTIEKLARIVMLGPPNKGSELVDKFHQFSLFRHINGPAGKQLGTSHSGFIKRLRPIQIDVGIIAGSRSLNPLLSSLIPEDNDGKVSVHSTKLVEMSDHITLPVSHSFMMNNSIVIEQTLYFLKNGHYYTKNE